MDILWELVSTHRSILRRELRYVLPANGRYFCMELGLTRNGIWELNCDLSGTACSGLKARHNRIDIDAGSGWVEYTTGDNWFRSTGGLSGFRQLMVEFLSALARRIGDLDPNSILFWIINWNCAAQACAAPELPELKIATDRSGNWDVVIHFSGGAKEIVTNRSWNLDAWTSFKARILRVFPGINRDEDPDKMYPGFRANVTSGVFRAQCDRTSLVNCLWQLSTHLASIRKSDGAGMYLKGTYKLGYGTKVR